MSRHQYLNSLRADIEATPYTPDDEPEHLRRTIEAAARDIVDAIERHGRRAAEDEDMRAKAKGLHRELATTRAALAKTATQLGKAADSGEPITPGEAVKLAEELVRILPTPKVPA